MVRIERHCPCFSTPTCDGGVDGLSIPFEHVGERRVVLARQSFGKGEFENILDSGEVLPVVCKSVIVLYPSVYGRVQANDLVCIQVAPPGCRGRFPQGRAEASLVEPFDQSWEGGFHDGLPSSRTSFEPSSG